ncbi:hypothetical protein PO909_033409, partial [Leuciscus waleckii]
PPESISTCPTTLFASGKTKQAGRKTTAKSSSPHPAKRTTLHAPTSLDTAEPAGVNTQLLQAVQSLSQTIKVLESKMSKFEHSFINSNTSLNPVINFSASPQFCNPAVGSSDPSSMPSTSSALPTFQQPALHHSRMFPLHPKLHLSTFLQQPQLSLLVGILFHQPLLRCLLILERTSSKVWISTWLHYCFPHLQLTEKWLTVVTWHSLLKLPIRDYNEIFCSQNS